MTQQHINRIEATAKENKLATAELSNCPFCDAKPGVDVFMTLDEPAHFKVVCIPCGASIRHDRRDKVIFHWNQRQPIIDQQREAIRELVEGLEGLKDSFAISDREERERRWSKAGKLIKKYKRQ